MTNPYQAIAEAAQAVADALYRLEREVNATQNTVTDQERLTLTIAKKYPFGRSLEDVTAESGEWAEHLDEAARKPDVTAPDETGRGHILGFNPCGSPGCHMCRPGEPRMNPVHQCCITYPNCHCPF